MWPVHLPDLKTLTPADQLWLIALAVEESGGPLTYVLSLRRLADRLQDLGWWLSEPADAKHATQRSPECCPGLGQDFPPNSCPEFVSSNSLPSIQGE